jgi:hypothetical protein
MYLNGEKAKKIMRDQSVIVFDVANTHTHRHCTYVGKKTECEGEEEREKQKHTS